MYYRIGVIALVIFCCLMSFHVGTEHGEERVCEFRKYDLKIHAPDECSSFLDTFCDSGCWDLKK